MLSHTGVPRVKKQTAKNHRIMEQPRLGGTSEDRLVQPSLGTGARLRPSSALSSRLLETPGDGDRHHPGGAAPGNDQAHSKAFPLCTDTALHGALLQDARSPGPW